MLHSDENAEGNNNVDTTLSPMHVNVCYLTFPSNDGPHDQSCFQCFQFHLSTLRLEPSPLIGHVLIAGPSDPLQQDCFHQAARESAPASIRAFSPDPIPRPSTNPTTRQRAQLRVCTTLAATPCWRATWLGTNMSLDASACDRITWCAPNLGVLAVMSPKVTGTLF